MAATIGERLRIAREERGIPLREISDQTRISVHFLEAIESNDYRRLPGGIFNRSFVKAYARYVGYDEKEAVDAYARHMRDQGEGSDDAAPALYNSKVYTDAPATRSPFLTVVLAVVILAILTAAALFLLKWYQKRSAVSGADATHGLMTRHVDVRNSTGAIVKDNSGIWKADYEQVLQ